MRSANEVSACIGQQRFSWSNLVATKFDVHFMYLPNVNFNDNFESRKSNVKLICLFVFFR